LIPAATAILLREAEGGAEVLLVQRHPQLTFMGGMWAFPGGRVEASDGSDAEPEQAFRAAAVRETCEECAVCLPENGLQLWAHWVTPSASSRRFDTRFYAARMPPDQSVVLDLSESIAFDWLTPASAVQMSHSRALAISPPTHFILEDLRLSLDVHGSLEAMLRAEANRIVPCILPRLAESVSGGYEAVMPWEDQYSSLPGEGVAIEGELPLHLQRIVALPSVRIASTTPRR
jgi:8-oxo-dGTP pyrophosphatase MutT (NUDIX family)